MAFLIACPNCGQRDVYEFRYGGEMQDRPAPDAAVSDWSAHFYFRSNVAGDESAWWYHTFGCRKWFVAVRNTVTNSMHSSSWPEEAHS